MTYPLSEIEKIVCKALFDGSDITDLEDITHDIDRGRIYFTVGLKDYEIIIHQTHEHKA